jgi:hypothetical protein
MPTETSVADFAFTALSRRADEAERLARGTRPRQPAALALSLWRSPKLEFVLAREIRAT